MRILLVNKYFYRKGGAETYFFALAEGLRALGHEVAFFSMQHPNNESSYWSNCSYTLVCSFTASTAASPALSAPAI